jgi:hypothetical protein
LLRKALKFVFSSSLKTAESSALIEVEAAIADTAPLRTDVPMPVDLRRFAPATLAVVVVLLLLVTFAAVAGEGAEAEAAVAGLTWGAVAGAAGFKGALKGFG